MFKFLLDPGIPINHITTNFHTWHHPSAFQDPATLPPQPQSWLGVRTDRWLPGLAFFPRLPSDHFGQVSSHPPPLWQRSVNSTPGSTSYPPKRWALPSSLHCTARWGPWDCRVPECEDIIVTLYLMLNGTSLSDKLLHCCMIENKGLMPTPPATKRMEWGKGSPGDGWKKLPPTLSPTVSPTLQAVCTQWAGAAKEALTARSIVPSFSNWLGAELIEKPPTLSRPGMKKSTHWPAAKLTPGSGLSTSFFTVGDKEETSITSAAAAPGALNWPAVRSKWLGLIVWPCIVWIACGEVTRSGGLRRGSRLKAGRSRLLAPAATIPNLWLW